MRLSLQEIVEATGGRVISPEARSPVPVITGVSTDSRTLVPGDLFVPLQGPRADGHAFIADAFRKGAAAALCARRVSDLPPHAVLVQVADPLRALGEIAKAYRGTLDVTVVGITGSVGKSTTTKMCAAVLGTRLRVAQTKEEWNAEVGVPLAILGLRPEHEVAVIEMAMRGLGQIAELVAVARPKIGVVTTVGESHLELLGSRANIARAKGELIVGLPEDGIAVLNADDPQVAALGALCRGRAVTYGVSAPADVRAERIRFDRTAMTFHLAAAQGTAEVRLPGWGRHHVSNALAAAAVGITLGLDVQTVSRGLAAFVPPKMRLQPVQAGDVLIINDAYNASPASMEAAFEVLEEVGRGRRLIAVLGEMKELGSQSPALHRQVGRDLARRPVSLLVTVGEGGEEIAAGAGASGMAQFKIVRMRSVEEAAHTVPGMVHSGDVVLVKGSRALEMERIVSRLVEVRQS